MAQQTWLEEQSDFCRHPNEAASDGHVADLEMQVACSVLVRQHVFFERSHAEEPHRGTPAELNITGPMTRCDEPLLDPLLEPELLDPLELDPLLEPLEPDELPELDPLDPDASSESSPVRGPLLLLLQAGAETETSTATAHGPSPRSHGYRRAASRRDVM
jgi:hypothetical protein